jgi:hypothetical protein
LEVAVDPEELRCGARGNAAERVLARSQEALERSMPSLSLGSWPL